MTFQEFCVLAGDKLSSDPDEIARYEYVWNSAIRSAAMACQQTADGFGFPGQQEGARLSAEAVMDLWVNPLTF